MARTRSRARTAKRSRSKRLVPAQSAQPRRRPVGARAVPTYGLTHIALAVRDAERAFEFYQRVFGMVATYRHDGWIQAQTPGQRDLFVFDEGAPRRGKPGGIAHFGFRLMNPRHIDAAARAITRAGGRITSRGHFTPDEPYLFCRDPDGYEIEIVFEPRTPLDPPERERRKTRRGR